MIFVDIDLVNSSSTIAAESDLTYLAVVGRPGSNDILSMDVDCHSNSVGTIRIQAVNGSSPVVRLQAINSGRVARLLDARMADSAEATALYPSELTIPSSVEPGEEVQLVLRFDLPVDAEPGDILESVIQLRGSHGSDQIESPIKVEIEVVEEGPLFRDDFGVDPVIGQFSLVH